MLKKSKIISGFVFLSVSLSVSLTVKAQSNEPHEETISEWFSNQGNYSCAAKILSVQPCSAGNPVVKFNLQDCSKRNLTFSISVPKNDHLMVPGVEYPGFAEDSIMSANITYDANKKISSIEVRAHSKKTDTSVKLIRAYDSANCAEKEFYHSSYEMNNVRQFGKSDRFLREIEISEGPTLPCNSFVTWK
jgi:hypothetical protein